MNNTLSSLEHLPYFTIEAVKQLLGDKATAAGSIRTALYRWTKNGDIIRLKKGVYMTRRFLDIHRTDAEFSSAVSAILIPQSYLSMEYILQRNAVLTDITYPVSAITIKQTRTFENRLGTFTYRNIKKNLYTGFTFSQYMGIPFALATPAKALFDYLYFRPWKRAEFDDISEGLRLNLEDFSQKDRDEFGAFVTMSQSRKMKHVLKHLRNTVWQL